MTDAVKSISFLGQANYLSRSVTVDGTSLGGLSGITYDGARNRFLSISDDRGTPPNEPGQPPRFYTLTLDLTDLSFNRGDVAFLSATRLLQANGNTYAPLSTDTEGIALTNRGTVFVASEGQVDGPGQIRTSPFVNEFEVATGRLVRALPVPEKFLPNGNTAANLTRGVRDNLAFESLTITPDQRFLITATEAALVQDGGAANVTTGSRSRILTYDLVTGQPVAEFLYNTDPIAKAPVPATAFATAGLVELLAIDNSGQRFLALERSFSVGVGGTGNSGKLYEVDLRGATNIASIPALNGTDLAAVRPAQKRLVLDLDALNLSSGLDNIEGLAFGPNLPNGQRSLIIVSDDNFSPAPPAPGVQAFTQIMAFGVSFSDTSFALAAPVTTNLPGGGIQILGSDGADNLSGSANGDRLLGLGGNDTITGLAGDDVLGGNLGNDLINAGAGNDSAFGGQGNDTINGEDGNDLLVGDLGSDSLSGGAGNDTLIGVNGTEIRFPGLNQIDTLSGGAGADLFVLGDQFRAYYDDGTGGLGLGDYALITDFALTEDNVQLIRNPDNRGATYVIGANPANTPSGAALFIDNDGVAGLSANDELIAIFAGLGVNDAAAITARFRFV